MRILEIGCGIEAGPYFDGATEHIIIDHLDYLVEAAHATDERFTPLVGDATDIPQLKDESIDIVLARNVFGDSGLNIHAPSKKECPDTTQSREQALNESTVRKLALMQEAARLLMTGGKLVIVEQYTPNIAMDFIDMVKNETLNTPVSLTDPSKTTLSKVTPANYSSYHSKHGKIYAWQSIKQRT